jgi:hypothetical protein
MSGLLDALRWKPTSRPDPSHRFVSDVEQCIPPDRVEGNGLRIILVNHSSVLIQHRSFNILTDPIWRERASPLSWIGPRRRRKPGVSWEELPRWIFRHSAGWRLAKSRRSLYRLEWAGYFALKT